MHGLFLAAVTRGYSLVVVRASRCRGFSCCRVCALDRVGSEIVAHGLSCPMACGSLIPGPGIKSMSPALAGGFLTIGPLGKSYHLFFLFKEKGKKKKMRPNA